MRNKKEHEYKNACELLSVLNSNNRALIQRMFATPTPDFKIRYQEIESLFGKDAAGKLPGVITSVGGSHRKIHIQSTVGFFDKFYVSEAKGAEVVGGIFRGHKSGQGNSMLPSVAIKMVCSTLEKVGLTAENIERYEKEVRVNNLT